MKKNNVISLPHVSPGSQRGGNMEMRCPRCRGDDARLLGTLNPEVVFECLECGEVWKKVNGNGGRSRRSRTRRKEVLAASVKITPADLRALGQLRRVALRRYRAALRRPSITTGNTAPSSLWGGREA